MLRRTGLITLALFFCSPGALAAPSMAPSNAPTATYEVEGSHASVHFGIAHMGMTTYMGRFNIISGRLNFDSARPEKSSVKIELDLESVDTPSDALDEKLRKDLFKTDVNKTATFVSTSVKKTGPTTGEIAGDLTIGAVTKPLALTVTFKGGQLHPFSNTYIMGFDAVGAIKRSEFGLDQVAWSGFVGDEVALTIAVEFLAEK
jgi:polyisoprenoid-binding protein YceI